MQNKWFNEMSVYQIWPRSFKDGNGDGIGDLKGVLDKLDYIKSIGVDAIWFSPIYASPQKDYGYDISDYRAIAPEYGTLDEFKTVLDGAHKRGLKVIMDLVINHTSDQHEWFKKSAKREGKYADYYIWRKGKGKSGKKFPNNWMATFPGDGWKWNEERGEYYLHLFAVEQPDLNHDNPDVREEIKSIMRFWLDMGIDGFREDVITYISKREGLPNGAWSPVMRGMEHYSPGPNIHKYLAEYREVLKDYDAMQVGEAPMMTPEKALKYVAFGKDQQLDMFFGFQHMEADCFMISYLRTRFRLVKLKKIYEHWQNALYKKAWNTNFLENHDQPRIISRYGSEKLRVESGKALAIMYTFLSGTHFIYQGQEIGMTDLKFEKWDDFIDVATFSAKSLMEKTHLFTKNGILKRAAYAARDNARTPVQWSAEKNAGFTTANKPWFTINPNFKDVNVAAAEKDSSSLLNFYRTLLTLRKSYKDAAIYGEFKMRLKRDKHLFVYDKFGEDGTKITIIANISEKCVNSKRALSFVDSGAQDVTSVYGNALGKTMKPYEAHVFVSKKKI